VAYAGSIFVFARFLKERGLTPQYPSKAIVSSAEVMTPSMRRLVEEVFGKPVFDRYGNREFGAIAAECRAHCGLHINESDCVVEIDSGDPFKKEGRILVTYLRNFAMPFIRYDTGDAGRFSATEPCPCGRTTLRIVPVMGRQSDVIRTASGDLIHGEYFTHLLYESKGVCEFQFVQETPSVYLLRLVADRKETQAQELRWTENILAAVGKDSVLRIEYVESIPVLPSGKRKFTVACDEIR
jgi:phenylacetate-CoA ligase